MGRLVVIPIDESENSQRAFDFFTSELLRPDDQVILLHIYQTPHLPSVSFATGASLPVDEWQKMISTQIESTKKIMDHYERTCEEKKIPKQTLLETGKPSDVICKIAKEKQATMIVMGSRGLNAMRRTFMGSVSNDVLHHSSVPVMVVPPPNHWAGLFRAYGAIRGTIKIWLFPLFYWTGLLELLTPSEELLLYDPSTFST